MELKNPGVLLTMGNHLGTLAAVRYFGKSGIPVILAEPHRFAASSASRFITQRVKCPNPNDLERFSHWLLGYGKSNPGLMLYPTCDDLAWLFARKRDELQQYFTMYQPNVETIYTLLNKRKLHDLCHSLDIPCPETTTPLDPTSLGKAIDSAPMPALIKPQTQITFAGHKKGQLCLSKAELRKEYEKFRSSFRHSQMIHDEDPSVAWPMIQAFHHDAMTNTINLAGFVDRTSNIFVCRASQKVMQKPRKIGIGLCFEGRQVNPLLAERIHRICQHTGYYGVFEAEFIHDQATDSYLLMDFNPRYYSQMAFEIARDLNLPGLVYSAAYGDDETVQALVNSAQAWHPETDYRYRSKWHLWSLLIAQTIAGRFSPQDLRQWLLWSENSGAKHTDAVYEPGDPAPVLFDILTFATDATLHPRSFVRTFFLND